jgi:glyoxylase-like metal-dependent hydrolase (beta-lactamase superfamily II)
MLYVRQLELGPMQNFVYLVGAAGAREAAVIDPAWDHEAILEAAERDGKTLVAALLSHHHHDHVNAVEPLLRELPGMRVHAQRSELEVGGDVLRGFGDALVTGEPGEVVQVGPLAVTCLHTPGHTPGSQCFACGGSVFTGDTLFINGCGRCDLAGGDPRQMFDSLHRVLGRLPNETRVYPGHDYADVPVSTIGVEKAKNPYFRRSEIEDFVAFRMRPR